MKEELSYWTVGTPKSALFRSDEPGKSNSYEAAWVGHTSLGAHGAVGCQQFVDVFSPLGRLVPIGIVGLVLAENNVPFDWTAFLFPLVNSDSFSVQADFADPQKINENREFIRFACEPGHRLSFDYSDPTEAECFGFSNPFLVSEPERKQEILEMLDFIDRKEPFFVEDAIFVAMQEAMFGTANWIASRLGHLDWFQQTFEQTAKAFLQKPRKLEIKELLRLRVDANRLIERNSREREHLSLPSKYDVFLSHFHGDSDSADEVLDAIRELLPSVHIFRTKATEEQQRVFEKYPSQFLEAARYSKCLVYLATPNSLGRGFIRQELGNNALRPILTLLVGVSRDDFEQQRQRELHVAYQDEHIYDLQDQQEWKRFIGDLGQVLGRKPGGCALAMPSLTPGHPSPRTKQEEGDSFLEWSRQTRGQR